MSEVLLARPLVMFLRDLGWDVHQEVAAPSGRVDIVAVHGKILHAIEVKSALTFSVLRQAQAHRPFFHYTSIAVPPARKSQDERRYAYGVARDRGIGAYTVREPTENDVREMDSHLRWNSVLRDDYYNRREGNLPISQMVRPVLLRRPDYARITALLCDETRTYAEAGNATGTFWSPFKATCAAILAAIKERGPLTTKELVTSIEHHYASDSSARGSLPKWLHDGKIPGVTADGGDPMRWILEPARRAGKAA